MFQKVTYRMISIMLCKALPVEQVNNTLEAIRRLSPEAKTALKSAYIFSRKVPYQEREDFMPSS